VYLLKSIANCEAEEKPQDREISTILCDVVNNNFFEPSIRFLSKYSDGGIPVFLANKLRKWRQV
jgi:hypothetical protein